MRIKMKRSNVKIKVSRITVEEQFNLDTIIETK